jgi:hypothetical protein
MKQLKQLHENFTKALLDDVNKKDIKNRKQLIKEILEKKAKIIGSRSHNWFKKEITSYSDEQLERLNKRFDYELVQKRLCLSKATVITFNQLPL